LVDFQSEKNYSGMEVYTNSKLMLIMYTYELARKLEGTRVTANVLMPGFVATNLGKNNGSLRSSIMFKIVRPMQISAKKGAETSVYLASSEDVKTTSGKCFFQETDSDHLS
jgi:NAD(P)-dependent dehydrogenase (short-subunit alcohol dehydrogenase family)